MRPMGGTAHWMFALPLSPWSGALLQDQVIDPLDVFASQGVRYESREWKS
jgi:hypothetical protein